MLVTSAHGVRMTGMRVAPRDRQAGEAPGQLPSVAMTAMVRRNLTRATELAGSLEVADGLWQKFMGLMGRPTLDPGTGLWPSRHERDPHDVHAL